MADRRELPILFRDELARKITAGQKTETRRPVTPQPPACGFVDGPHVSSVLDCARGQLADGFSWGARARFGTPGDRLWVRETWAAHAVWDDHAPAAIPAHAATVAWYRALGEDAPSRLISSTDPEPKWTGQRAPTNRGRWRPGIHMPRAWARLLLDVVDVRIERLQELTEEAAIAEGAPVDHGLVIPEAPLEWARRTWDALYPKALQWEANPWVWVVRFEVVR